MLPAVDRRVAQARKGCGRIAKRDPPRPKPTGPCCNDDERSGGFEPLRFVPKGKTVVLKCRDGNSATGIRVAELLFSYDDLEKECYRYFLP